MKDPAYESSGQFKSRQIETRALTQSRHETNLLSELDSSVCDLSSWHTGDDDSREMSSLHRPIQPVVYVLGRIQEASCYYNLGCDRYIYPPLKWLCNGASDVSVKRFRITIQYVTNGGVSMAVCVGTRYDVSPFFPPGTSSEGNSQYAF